jgi:hypothetical protein
VQRDRTTKFLLNCVHKPGLPDFSWRHIPKREKIYQITTKYTKRPKYTTWLQYIPKGLKIYQHCHSKGPPKYGQFGIFGMKIFHPPTLV